MSKETLNFWLFKFREEITNQSVGRYPPETLYLPFCGLNRYLAKNNNSFNVVEKADRRQHMDIFWTPVIKSLLVFKSNNKLKVRFRVKEILVFDVVYLLQLSLSNCEVTE